MKFNFECEAPHWPPPRIPLRSTEDILPQEDVWTRVVGYLPKNVLQTENPQKWAITAWLLLDVTLQEPNMARLTAGPSDRKVFKLPAAKK